ncbi:hypothetical protein IFR05_009970 [Cadophora sp. M221]|nr:hypothetical protein IFR05_009970 [Cadophora sp. M221]
MSVSRAATASITTEMARPSQRNASKEGLGENDTVGARYLTRPAARSFDAIAQTVELNSIDKTEHQNPTGVTGGAENGKIERPMVGKFHEDIPTEETSATIKTKRKPEFPREKYKNELDNIQAKLDLVTSTKLIDTYNLLGHHQVMHATLKSLKSRTANLLIELRNRKKIYAVARRLVYGDGLDSNLGRLDRDVMWFIAELRCRQMDSRSSSTLIH